MVRAVASPEKCSRFHAASVCVEFALTSKSMSWALLRIPALICSPSAPDGLPTGVRRNGQTERTSFPMGTIMNFHDPAGECVCPMVEGNKVIGKKQVKSMNLRDFYLF